MKNSINFYFTNKANKNFSNYCFSLSCSDCNSLVTSVLYSRSGHLIDVRPWALQGHIIDLKGRVNLCYIYREQNDTLQNSHLQHQLQSFGCSCHPWGACSSLPPTSGHMHMSHLSLACGKSQCSIRPTCGFCVLICFGVLFVSLLSKCLKISQFLVFFSFALVFFSSYLSSPTHLWFCVELCC